MRIAQALVIASLFIAACFDGAPTNPETSQVALESTPLLSGGEGVLASESYAQFFLRPRLDESGAVVERRWTNFRVEVEGAEVDSWRIDNTRIGFRVPRVATSMLAIDATGSPAVSGSFSVRALGGLFLGRLNNPCTFTGIPHLIPVGQEVIWSGVECPLGEGEGFPTIGHLNGYASIRPGVPGSEMTPIPGAHEFADTPAISMSAGTSYDTGRTILELPGTFGTGTETWAWSLGGNPQPIEQIACLPEGTWPGVALAEVAPGVCITFNYRDGQLRRNGVTIDTCCDRGYWGPTFRISPAGTAVLKDLIIRGDHWPIMDASGQVIHRISDYFGVAGVVFSPDGGFVYVLALIENLGWVLDVIDISSGARVQRVPLETSAMSSGGLALDGNYLYLSRRLDVDGEKQLRVERWNLADLTLDRAIAMGPAPFGHNTTGIQIEILPELGGRRVHVVSYIEDNLGVIGYTVDFE